MPDNVEFQSSSPATPAASTIVATDQIGTAHYQIVKLGLGADGSASLLGIGQKTAASSLPVIIATDQTAIPISGSLSASGTFPVTQSGTWNINTLTAGSVSINNPAGASAVNIQDGGNSLTVDGTVAATQSGTWNVGTLTTLTAGSVSINNPSGASAVNIQDGGNSITVDGTIAATQSGTWNVGTVTTLTAGSVSINNPSGASAVNIQDGGNSLTVDGSVTANPTRPSTVTTASVVAASTNTTLLASNANRLGATIYNDSPAALRLKFGATSSSTSFNIRMAASSYFEVPAYYTGIIDGYWAGASGQAMVGEMTA